MYVGHHQFELFTFEKPSYCDACHKLLHGCYFQGYFCSGNNCTVYYIRMCPSCPPPSPPPPVACSRASHRDCLYCVLYKGVSFMFSPPPPSPPPVACSRASHRDCLYCVLYKGVSFMPPPPPSPPPVACSRASHRDCLKDVVSCSTAQAPSELLYRFCSFLVTLPFTRHISPPLCRSCRS